LVGTASSALTDPINPIMQAETVRARIALLRKFIWCPPGVLKRSCVHGISEH
jgi:hypothetical protein